MLLQTVNAVGATQGTSAQLMLREEALPEAKEAEEETAEAAEAVAEAKAEAVAEAVAEAKAEAVAEAVEEEVEEAEVPAPSMELTSEMSQGPLLIKR